MDDFFKNRALEYHSAGKAGKTSTIPGKPLETPEDLAMAYTPGVAAPAMFKKGKPVSKFFNCWLKASSWMPLSAICCFCC